jgi:putative heme iron utilization protein
VNILTDELQGAMTVRQALPPTSAQEPSKDQSVLRDTDEEARHLARMLVRGARHMALAVLDPTSGFPSASRVLTGTDLDGVPVILVSALSGHTKGLAGDPRCSLLAGETGKGDPLAHPRITVQCIAEKVERDSPVHLRIRQRFLDRHPKAKLYIDFPDFYFFRLVPQSASLNGGFGRAYALDGSDLVIANPGSGEEWSNFSRDIRELTDEANSLAAWLGAKNAGQWRFVGADSAGLDLIAGDTLLRHEFRTLQSSPEHASQYIFNMSKTV